MVDLQTAPLDSSSGSLQKPSPEGLAKLAESDADKLVKAVEAAGYVHPEAPEGFSTPGHKLAAEQANDPVDHLAEIASLAEQAKTATPSGVQSIADQIMAHVEAMK